MTACVFCAAGLLRQQVLDYVEAANVRLHRPLSGTLLTDAARHPSVGLPSRVYDPTGCHYNFLHSRDRYPDSGQCSYAAPCELCQYPIFSGLTCIDLAGVWSCQQLQLKICINACQAHLGLHARA